MVQFEACYVGFTLKTQLCVCLLNLPLTLNIFICKGTIYQIYKTHTLFYYKSQLHLFFVFLNDHHLTYRFVVLTFEL